jgi:hypothetical protein
LKELSLEEAMDLSWDRLILEYSFMRNSKSSFSTRIQFLLYGLPHLNFFSEGRKSDVLIQESGVIQESNRQEQQKPLVHFAASS